MTRDLALFSLGVLFGLGASVLFANHCVKEAVGR